MDSLLYRPYNNESLDFIYNLLFCDFLPPPTGEDEGPYFNILSDPDSEEAAIRDIAEDGKLESRVRLFAYRKLAERGITGLGQELLGVVVEIGLPGGLDVLACYHDHTARYINYSGKLIIWENPDHTEVREFNTELFEHSRHIISQIGPWEEERRSPPPQGMLRISFLVSDGLYFGEGPADGMFADGLAGPALHTALDIMQIITSDKSR